MVAEVTDCPLNSYNFENSVKTFHKNTFPKFKSFIHRSVLFVLVFYNSFLKLELSCDKENVFSFSKEDVV